jgi:atypical dual specificity phosphatase
MPSHPPWPHPLHLHALPQHHHDRQQSPGGYSPSPAPPSHTPRYPATSTYSEILPRLYISDLGVAENPQLLASLGITHVLSILRGFVDLRTTTSHITPTIKHTQIPLDDLPFAELAAVLPSTTAFIHNALESSPHAKVLVHCVQGVSRSASVVSAYLMWRYGWSVMDSVGFVKRKRPVAEPSYGFLGQLGEYGDFIRSRHGR